ncbi:phosphohistidine phosphatase SixA [Thiothrix subterranea]|uniref:phosphohistidine phosphatase SixA n=1 Tax=Thiothrix subterranea TaxID=2735563 RepID=UPI00192CB0DF|nr:phosphohistidine phosphatase SixA [Thiothrix subterranea]QQZ30121.1 phosphohistidine phosphatase SixA [Thiothrix subterranea]
MTTTLTFLRHATAEDHNLPIPDEARHLTPKGHKQVQRVARFCQRHALLPSHLLCSPLVRALETAQDLRKHLPDCPKIIIVPWLAHSADTQTALQALAALAANGDNNIWLVGHEPAFSTLIAHLLGSPNSRIKVKKAGLIRLEVDMTSGVGELQWNIPNALMK